MDGVKVDSPIKFDSLIRKTPSELAEEVIDDDNNFFIPQSRKRGWYMNTTINGSQASNWAEELSNHTGEEKITLICFSNRRAL